MRVGRPGQAVARYTGITFHEAPESHPEGSMLSETKHNLRRRPATIPSSR
jgi:hypothetical protein